MLAPDADANGNRLSANQRARASCGICEEKKSGVEGIGGVSSGGDRGARRAVVGWTASAPSSQSIGSMRRLLLFILILYLFGETVINYSLLFSHIRCSLKCL